MDDDKGFWGSVTQTLGDALTSLWDNTGGAAASAVGDFAANQVLNTLVSIVEWVTKGIFAAAYLFTSAVWELSSTASAPNMDADFLYTWVGRVFTISIPLMVILMIFQAILALVKFSIRELLHALTGMVYAIVGTTLSLPIIGGLQQGVDSIADWVLRASQNDLLTSGENVAETLLGGDIGALIVSAAAIGGASLAFGLSISLGAGAVLSLVGGALFASAFGLFIALEIRTVLLYIVVVLGPVMLAGAVWRKTWTWATRYLGIVMALVVTKLGVVIVFSFGMSIIADLAGNVSADREFLDAIGQLAAAAIMIGMAALVPYACFKFFDFAGETLVERLSDQTKGTVDKASHATKRLGQKVLNPANAASTLGIGGGMALAGAGGASNVVGKSTAALNQPLPGTQTAPSTQTKKPAVSEKQGKTEANSSRVSTSGTSSNMSSSSPESTSPQTSNETTPATNTSPKIPTPGVTPQGNNSLVTPPSTSPGTTLNPAPSSYPTQNQSPTTQSASIQDALRPGKSTADQ